MNAMNKLNALNALNTPSTVRPLGALRTAVSALALVGVLGLSASAALAAGNNGQVTFSGTVVDSPCNLAPGQDGTDIKVPFGQLSLSQLNAGVVSEQKFDIHLENCNLTGKTADITFTSPDLTEGSALLTAHGTAAGVGIGLANITFGTAKPLTGLTAQGNNTLSYTATAQRLSKDTTVTAGDFSAIANFAIAYK